jgi:hypothetical protein
MEVTTSADLGRGIVWLCAKPEDPAQCSVTGDRCGCCEDHRWDCFHIAGELAKFGFCLGPRAVRGAGLTLQKNKPPAEEAPEGRRRGGGLP